MSVFPNDDRTVIGAAFAESQNALPAGTRFAELEITGLIGEGGFGIVYLAYDHSLERNVAVKEYLPASLAMRTAGDSVSVNSERNRDTFQAGLRSFVNEARLLAKFDHPSLLKVYRFFEANGTAYMVMPYYEGITLKQAVQEMNGAPDEAWLKNLLSQILDALGVLHGEQCYHRDIAPDNILLLPGNRSLLLDFGAARRVIGDMTQALTVILKPGYAPIEQYAEVPSMRQGPWTDFYALASVVYFAITGRAPVPAVARMMSDPLAPLAQTAAGRYSSVFLQGVDSALAVRPEDRPQDSGEFRRLLDLPEQREHLRSGKSPAARPVETRGGKRPAATGRRLALGAMVAIVVAALGIGYLGLRDKLAPEVFVESTALPPPFAEEPAPSPLPPSAQEPMRPSSPPPSAKEPARPPPSPPIAPPSIAKAPAEAPIAKTFDPLDALSEVFEGRNHAHAVSVSVKSPRVRVKKDRMGFSIRSSKPGYVYVLMVGTDGAHLNLLFPNAIDEKNKVEAGKELSLPRRSWEMIADGPAGTNHFVAIVSDSPRDFSAAGLKTGDWVSEFPLEIAAQLYRSHSGPHPLFAGRAVCPAGETCSESFGAAVFSIEEIG